MAKDKITEEDLVARIRGEITDSLGYMGDPSMWILQFKIRLSGLNLH